MTHRCGYVALLGRPNAGKSTLLNSLVGDKLAVVSRKPQTTRNRILGITLVEDAQILFLDTPGVHQATGRNLINTTMNRVAFTAACDADLIIYLVDSTQGWTEDDTGFLSRILGKSTAPFAIMASKVDSLQRHPLRESMSQIAQGVNAMLSNEEWPIDKTRMLSGAPRMVSAKRPESVGELKNFIAQKIPEGPWLFNGEDLTDMPETFVCSELIREQLFRQLGQEIPYGAAVKVESLTDKGGEKGVVVIQAQIIVTRASHKGIVVGKGGARIKELGTVSRESLERHFDKKVFLELSVKVAEGWIDDERLIAELAHMDLGSLGEGADHHV